MANRDAPSGLSPVRRVSGLPLGAVQKVYFPVGDSVAAFVGDIVSFADTGGAAALKIQGEDMEGVPAVTRSLITVFDVVGTDVMPDVMGVIVGFKPDPDNLMNKHRPASTARIAYIYPLTQDFVWEIQEDAAGTPMTAAMIGLNVQLAQTQTGSSTTGLSGMEIDSSTAATTNTHPFKVIGLSKKIGNRVNVDGVDVDQAVYEVVVNSLVSFYTPGLESLVGGLGT